MTEKFYDFDPAEMLDSDEAIEVFLTEAKGMSDAKFVVSTLGVHKGHEQDCPADRTSARASDLVCRHHECNCYRALDDLDPQFLY
jgi:hypothetical protein